MSTSEQAGNSLAPQPLAALGSSTLQRLQALQHASTLYGRGDWPEAERLCRAILASQPGELDALNLLGAITSQTGRAREAAELWKRVASARPGDATAQNNYGNALKDLGRLEEALERYGHALRLRPDYALALNNRGLALQGLGHLEAALASLNQALASRPEYPEACYNRGNVLRDLGRLEAALASFERALQLRPSFPEAHNNRGNVLRDLGRYAEALAAFQCALQVRPRYAEAWYNCGRMLRDLGRREKALDSYEQALRLRPNYAEALNGYGTALHELHRCEEALASFERAVLVKPDYADAHSNRGNVLRDLGRIPDALDSYRRALAIRPDHAAAHNNLGNALHELHRFEEALEHYDRALQLQPDYAEAHNNRGYALQLLQRPDEALASYARALALRPQYAAAHFNRATAWLLSGNFDRGWAEYEWRGQGVRSRFRTAQGPPQPLWLGEEPLAGKTILLHAEQGLGDTIQFCRYVPLVATLGARVCLEVPQTLASLLASLGGLAQISMQSESTEAADLPAFDYQCPLMSLPLAFKTTLTTIPATVPYLQSDSTRRHRWAARLAGERDASRPGAEAEQRRLRVGLVWSGGVRRDRPERWPVDARRNISLAKLARLRHPGIEFYSLQKGEPAESEWAQLSEQGWYGPPLIDYTGELHDFADTAGLIEQLDLVISVDTSTAHLAGALGKPVWILNRFDTCWRWLLDRIDSPWYPTARLYRQERPGDWENVIERVRVDLHALAADAARAAQ